MSKTNIKATIDANVKRNGNQAITGQILNAVLNGMVDSLADQDETADKFNDHGVKLSELEQEITIKGEDITISTNSCGGYIASDTGLWKASGTNYGSLTPFSQYKGCRIRLMKKELAKLLQFAFLKDNTFAANTQPHYCDGTSLYNTSAGEEPMWIEMLVPEDCEYLHVRIVSSSSGDTTPYVFEVKSLAKEVVDVKEEMSASINEVRESLYKSVEVDLSSLPKLNYIILSSTGLWNNNTNYKHKLVPIPSGYKRLIVKKNPTLSSYIAFMKSNSVTPNSSADFAEGTEAIALDDANPIYEGSIPEDAKYVYVRSVYGGSSSPDADYTPSYLGFSVSLDSRISRIESDRIEYPLSLFHKVAVIGASWDSGYFSTDGTNRYESNSHSWLANAARRNGVEWNCFARKSTWTRLWLTTDAQYCKTKMQNADACDLYIISLNGNDAKYGGESYIGNIGDINDADFNLNADTYYGNYAKIISLIKQKSPYARIICIRAESSDAVRKKFSAAMEAVAQKYGLPVIVWNNDEWYDRTMTNSSLLIGDHPTTMQLGGISLAFERLLSRCISENYDYFDRWYNHSATDVEVIKA